MYFSRRLAALLLAGPLLLSACGFDPSDESSQLDIINGQMPSELGLIQRSTVALANARGQTFCSGTLIADRYVLTAAHCLQSHRGELYIAFGRNSSEFSYVAANRFTLHPNYTGSFNRQVPGDIAMVELARSAPSGYQPVDVYKGGLRAGDRVYLAGFGQTERGTSGQLLFTEVGVSRLTSSEFTVHENGTGSCYGDSGGPAYVLVGNSLQVIGATSRGTVGCRGSSTYSLATYFLPWMDNWTGLRF